MNTFISESSNSIKSSSALPKVFSHPSTLPSIQLAFKHVQHNTTITSHTSSTLEKFSVQHLVTPLAPIKEAKDLSQDVELEALCTVLELAPKSGNISLWKSQIEAEFTTLLLSNPQDFPLKIHANVKSIKLALIKVKNSLSKQDLKDLLLIFKKFSLHNVTYLHREYQSLLKNLSIDTLEDLLLQGEYNIKVPATLFAGVLQHNMDRVNKRDPIVFAVFNSQQKLLQNDFQAFNSQILSQLTGKANTSELQDLKTFIEQIQDISEEDFLDRKMSNMIQKITRLETKASINLSKTTAMPSNPFADLVDEEKKPKITSAINKSRYLEPFFGDCEDWIVQMLTSHNLSTKKFQQNHLQSFLKIVEGYSRAMSEAPLERRQKAKVLIEALQEKCSDSVKLKFPEALKESSWNYVIRYYEVRQSYKKNSLLSDTQKGEPVLNNADLELEVDLEENVILQQEGVKGLLKKEEERKFGAMNDFEVQFLGYFEEISKNLTGNKYTSEVRQALLFLWRMAKVNIGSEEFFVEVQKIWFEKIVPLKNVSEAVFMALGFAKTKTTNLYLNKFIENLSEKDVQDLPFSNKLNLLNTMGVSGVIYSRHIIDMKPALLDYLKSEESQDFDCMSLLFSLVKCGGSWISPDLLKVSFERLERIEKIEEQSTNILLAIMWSYAVTGHQFSSNFRTAVVELSKRTKKMALKDVLYFANSVYILKELQEPQWRKIDLDGEDGRVLRALRGYGLPVNQELGLMRQKRTSTVAIFLERVKAKYPKMREYVWIEGYFHHLYIPEKDVYVDLEGAYSRVMDVREKLVFAKEKKKEVMERRERRGGSKYKLLDQKTVEEVGKGEKDIDSVLVSEKVRISGVL